MNNWIKLSDRLPVIPEGKYGVGVIIATWDGESQDVTHCNYCKVISYSGNYIDPGVSHLPLDAKEFLQLYFNNGKTGWMPIMDEITHWQYYPEPPLLKNVVDQ